jgi:polyphosphate kinase
MKQYLNPIICPDGLMVNRDQSWLQFNLRVLNEASDPTNPLLERFRFLSISSNNLDEFFMIRIGSLFDIVTLKKDALDSRTNIPLQAIIKTLYKDIDVFIKRMEEVYHGLIKEFNHRKISILSISELQEDQMKIVNEYFLMRIKPFLSPQVIDANHPFPHVLSKIIHIALKLNKKDKDYLGLIPIPSYLPALLRVDKKKHLYIRVDELILNEAKQVFNMYTITESTMFSVKRNADLNYYDEVIDDATNTRIKIKQLLNQRKLQQVIHLELSNRLSEGFYSFLLDRFGLKKYQVSFHSVPMRIEMIREFIANELKRTKPNLLYPVYQPLWPVELNIVDSMISNVLKRDVLLHFPYDSMEPFLKLIKEVADDPDVISIKITIYRLAKTAKLIEYLSRAAENGKEVVVIIELRARFDEQNNIDWSERLEKAGCKIMYGLDKYKVHSKICLITMVKNKEVIYITQVGTGNYNERTVEQYEDFSLITANKEIGIDALNFFYQILLNSQEDIYKHLLVSPNLLKKQMMSLIEQEKEKGALGFIMMKINAITDVDIIKAFHEASLKGVKIRILVRSICCIRPSVEKLTPTVEARSIVGRFLEHSRVYVFGKGDEQKIYLSSADMMTRNTERRVEAAIPIYDETYKKRIVEILEISWHDAIKGKMILSNGTHANYIDENAKNVQEYFMQEKLKLNDSL